MALYRDINLVTKLETTEMDISQGISNGNLIKENNLSDFNVFHQY